MNKCPNLLSYNCKIISVVLKSFEERHKFCLYLINKPKHVSVICTVSD